MKSVSNIQHPNSANFRKNKKRKTSYESEENRMKKAKLNDPLYASTSLSSNGNIIQTEGEGYSKASPSGRKEWKMKHRKGEFNPNVKKTASYQTQGTFQKSKKKLTRTAGR
jgi:hypothetical protein